MAVSIVSAEKQGYWLRPSSSLPPLSPGGGLDQNLPIGSAIFHVLGVFLTSCTSIQYSCAVPYTSGSYILQHLVDCICPQMTSVAKVENYWLQDSYQTVLPTIITHIQHIFQQANFAWQLYSFVHQTKNLLFCYKFHVCLGACLKKGSQTLTPWGYPSHLCFILQCARWNIKNWGVFMNHRVKMGGGESNRNFLLLFMVIWSHFASKVASENGSFNW